MVTKTHSVSLEDLDSEILNAIRRKSTTSLATAEQYIDAAFRKKDFYQLAKAWEFKSALLSNNEQYEAAVESMKVSLNTLQKHFSENIEDHCLCYTRIGMYYLKVENFELAINYNMKALAFKDFSQASNTCSQIAVCYKRMGNFEEALKYHQKGLEVAKEREESRFIVVISYNLANTNYENGDLEAARKHLEDLFTFLEVAENAEYLLNINNADIHIYTLQALVMIDSGEKEEGLKKLEKYTQIAKERATLSLYSSNVRKKADLYFGLGREAEAIRSLKEALDIVSRNKLRLEEKLTLQKLIDYYKSKENYKVVAMYLEQFQKLLQSQFQETRDKNLQKIIAERQQEIYLLGEKNNEIEEQNAILKQFAYIISHDLREPIRGITGFASMLNRKYAENLDETAGEYLRFILSEANLMNRNLTRLLKYTTIERRTNDVETIDIQQIITQIKHQYRNESFESFESFELNIHFEGVPLKMQQIHAILLLTELIDNAIQFKKENEDCIIEIKNELKEGYYHLSVKDYGISIDPIYHDKIFKIFNKINKHESEGAGVGLAICERIAQLYKGNISVESTFGQCTTFCIKVAA